MKETDYTWENVRDSEQARESAVLQMTSVTGIGQKNVNKEECKIDEEKLNMEILFLKKRHWKIPLWLTNTCNAI